VCGPAFNDAPSYRAAEAPIGRKVQREVLSTMVPDEIERGDAVVIAGDSFAIDYARRTALAGLNLLERSEKQPSASLTHYSA
jgi:hypothetical protein